MVATTGLSPSCPLHGQVFLYTRPVFFILPGASFCLADRRADEATLVDSVEAPVCGRVVLNRPQIGGIRKHLLHIDLCRRGLAPGDFGFLKPDHGRLPNRALAVVQGEGFLGQMVNDAIPEQDDGAVRIAPGHKHRHLLLADQFRQNRAGIANYELGRSLPGKSVITKLADALGVEREALKAEPTVEDWEEQFRALGPPDSVSDDEMALIRLLRCAPPDDAITFVQQLIDYFEAADDAFQFVDSEQAARDLARLYKARKRKQFQHGMTAYSVRKVARFLAGEED